MPHHKALKAKTAQKAKKMKPVSKKYAPAVDTIPANWAEHLSAEQQEHARALLAKVDSLRQTGTVIFPPAGHIFAALHKTPFARVRVVIVGQDPYHKAGQAHGMSFSVPEGVALPPSLRNIYKECGKIFAAPATKIASATPPATATATPPTKAKPTVRGARQEKLAPASQSSCAVQGENTMLSPFSPAPAPLSGDLSHWAAQGVLLLNSVLSVEAGKANSHAALGWQGFTDECISVLSQHAPALVFMLWGAHAQSKIPLIDAQKHCVLCAPHPSPLSAYRGFLGCGHFTKANAWLTAHGQAPIVW